jgi:HEAT repeat protein
MKKLKKKKAPAKKGVRAKPTRSQVRRNRLIFGAGALGALALIFALGYGYTAVTTWWNESRGLSRIASEDEETRIEGMWNLAKGRLIQHTPKVCALLHNDPSVNVRKSAAAVLAGLNDRRAIPWLVYALGDEADSVAEAAMGALGRFLGQEISWEEVIDWWQAHRGEYPADPDLPVGVPVVSAMEKLLGAEEYYMRLAAVKRLARVKHIAARPLLERAANDPHDRVRQAAREILNSE